MDQKPISSSIEFEGLQNKNETLLTVHQCGWERCESGHAFGPAVRNHFLIHFIVSGKGVFAREKQTYPLSAGDGFLIVPDETTRYCADAETPWEYYWVGFSGIDAKRLLKQAGLSRTSPVFHCPQTDTVSEYFRSIIQIADHQQDIPREYALLGNLYLFFSKIAENTRPVDDASSSESCLRKAVSYIQNNYSYPITIQKVADYASVSRSHLFKLFQRYLQTSPQDYLLLYRIETAAKLLRTTQLKVGQVCFSVGFRDINHFSKIFKSRLGLTPSEYRIS